MSIANILESTSPDLLAEVSSTSNSSEILKGETNPSELVTNIVTQLKSTMQIAVGEIRKINLNAHFLSVNASIEAARAEGSGAAFGEVAKELQRLSYKTDNVAEDLEQRTKSSIDLVCSMAKNICGTRLSDIALNSLDLIDRNLYERTCDVRWWATDSSFVNALQEPTEQATRVACQRLGVILDSYTVYFDIVLCDLTGRIVANGRPDQFESIGKDISKEPWFTRAIATKSGAEFAFQTAHKSNLVGHQSSLIYSATVRRDGVVDNASTGVLGVIFNWGALATAVLENASLSNEESKRTLRLIIDDKFNVIASSRTLPADYQLPVQKIERLFNEDKGYIYETIAGKPVCIAHAIAPGFETYSTGWHALLVQDVE